MITKSNVLVGKSVSARLLPSAIAFFGIAQSFGTARFFMVLILTIRNHIDLDLVFQFCREPDVIAVIELCLGTWKNIRLEEIDPQAAELLLGYSWPGNVRELENLIERILVLTPKERLEPEDLPTHILSGGHKPDPGPKTPLNLKVRLRQLEADTIKEALIQTGGNRAEAARRLKISYPSLLAKIKMYDL